MNGDIRGDRYPCRMCCWKARASQSSATFPGLVRLQNSSQKSEAIPDRSILCLAL